MAILGALLKPFFTWYVGKLIRRLLTGFLLFTVGMTLLFRFVPPPITPLMLIRAEQARQAGRSPKIDKQWRPLEDLRRPMRAVIAAEDQRFPRHLGFDFQQIWLSVKNNVTKNKPLRGGSTISQQTAKNVFLWNGRNWIRKGLEVYFTLLIEIFWSKARIMEVYLNIVELGPGIYGFEAAARHYFRKPASELTMQEAALLAACLPSPLKRSPARPDARLLAARNRIVYWTGRLPANPL